MNDTLAIVVTYNRKELLAKCLNSLYDQTDKGFDILVVNNASTDGTEEYLKMLKDERTTYLSEGKNVGGAGGFHDGINEGVRLGYAYLWLMDDDVLATPTALEQLKKADKNLQGEYGFLSSLALFTDGTPCKMNNCLLKGRLTTDNAIFVAGDTYNEVKTATFVSFFVKAATVKTFGLPIKEMFLWSDDTEYSSRISKEERGVFVPQSVVVHAMMKNEMPDLATLGQDRIERMALNIRNRYYIARRDGFKKKLRFYARHFLLYFRVLTKAKDHKIRRLSAICKGIRMGWGFRPKPESVGEDPIEQNVP